MEDEKYTLLPYARCHLEEKISEDSEVAHNNTIELVRPIVLYTKCNSAMTFSLVCDENGCYESYKGKENPGFCEHLFPNT